MQKSVVENLINRAATNLFAHQPNIFDFTSETNQTEWSLAHHLANEIHLMLTGYDCDIDVIKRPYNDMRPDIIFHERNTHKHNFLVIEVKKDGRKSALAEDLKKIKRYWFAEALRYQFGAVVNLLTDKTFSVAVVESKISAGD